MHDNHSIRICGHTLNWHKPIKPYILLKTVLVVSFLAMPAMAAESIPSKQASLVPAHPQSVKAMDISVTGKADPRDQRSAGPSSLSPAMALAMALGVRTATGPMERVQKTMAPSTKDMKHLTGLDKRDALVIQKTKGAHVLSKKGTYSRLALE